MSLPALGHSPGVVREQDEVTLPAEPGSVREARSFVRRVLAGWEVAGDVLETVVLLTSEVATNAVLHARSPYRLVLLREAAAVRVTVYDDAPGQPRVRPASLSSTTGRGLGLVDELSGEWGTTGTGVVPKGVWFSVPL